MWRNKTKDSWKRKVTFWTDEKWQKEQRGWCDLSGESGKQMGAL